MRDFAEIFRIGNIKLELLGPPLGQVHEPPQSKRKPFGVLPPPRLTSIEPAVLWIDVKHQIRSRLATVRFFCLAESGKRQNDIIVAAKRIETNSAGFEVAWRAGEARSRFC